VSDYGAQRAIRPRCIGTVKQQSRYRPGVAQRVPGIKGSQIS